MIYDTLSACLAAQPHKTARLRPDGRYEAIEPPPPAAPPPALSPRQLRLALLAAGKLDQVEAAIAALPEPQRASARIAWEYAIEYERNHPLVAQLAAAIGLSAAEVDALWAQAATL